MRTAFLAAACTLVFCLQLMQLLTWLNWAAAAAVRTIDTYVILIYIIGKPVQRDAAKFGAQTSFFKQYRHKTVFFRSEI